MTRRILIEIEAEGSEELFPEIMKLVMQHVDMNCRFRSTRASCLDIFGKPSRDKDTGSYAAWNDTA